MRKKTKKTFFFLFFFFSLVLLLLKVGSALVVRTKKKTEKKKMSREAKRSRSESSDEDVEEELRPTQKKYEVEAAATVAPKLRCSRCKSRYYASATEQKEDWPAHKLVCCVATTNKKFQMDLSVLWTEDGALDLFGPRLVGDKWLIGPGEMPLSTCAAEILRNPAPARLPLDSRFVQRKFSPTHAQNNIAYPTHMLCVYTRIFDNHELTSGKKLALPDNVPLSLADFWSWFTSGKCDLYVAAQMAALRVLKHSTSLLEFVYRQQLVVEWGSVEVLYKRPFTPVCRTFGWESVGGGATKPTQDIDSLTDACAHRILYIKCADQSLTYVDLTSAQYQASDNSSKSSIPVLVMHGAEELGQRGFVLLPGSKPIDNGPEGDVRFNQMLSTCSDQYLNGVLATARQLLDYLATKIPPQMQQKNRDALARALPLVHTPAWKLMNSNKPALPVSLRK